MTAVSGGAGWWLASDGKWYPPDLAAAPAATPPSTLPPLVLPPASPQFAPTGAAVPSGQPPSPWGVGPPPYPGPAPAPAGYPTPAPYPYVPGTVLPIPKTSPMAVWALVLVILLGAIGALVGIPLAFVTRSKIQKSGGALKGAGLALAALIVGFGYVALVVVAIAIPTFLGVTSSGPSLQVLNFSVRGQIAGTAPNDCSVSGFSDVACQRPSQWTNGSTFTCIAYGPIRTEAGRYYGTAEPNASDGTYQWNGRYFPTT